MIKKLVVTSIFLFFFVIHLTPSVTAHELQTSGSVGAVIHVSPDDDPVANTPTDFYFELKDKNGKLAPSNCECKAYILQDGKEIFSQPLFGADNTLDLENAGFSFTFPEKDIYQVKITGTPSVSNTFESFTLVWNIRVAKEAEAQSMTQTSDTKENILNKYGGYVLGIGIIVGSIVLFNKKTQTKKSGDMKSGGKNE